MTIWYVTENGNGDGLSEVSPKSRAWANSSSHSPGDTIVLCGLFTGQFTVPVSGTSGSPVTYTSSVTNQAVLARTGGSYNFNIGTPRQYVHIKNLELLPPTSGASINGVSGDYSGFTIDNCKFFGVDGSVANTIISFIATGNDINITNNFLYKSTYDAISIQLPASGNLTNLNISNNVISSPGRHGIRVYSDNTTAALSAGNINGLIINNNVIYGSGIDSGQAAWTTAWYNSSGIVVNKRSITTEQWHYNVKVNGNKIYNSSGKAIYLSYIDGLEVNNNTVLNSSYALNGQGIGLYGCKNYTCNSNNIKDVYTLAGYDYDGHGIDLDCVVDEIDSAALNCATGTVAYNVINNAKASINTPGINLLSTTNTDIFSNIIIDCYQGIRMSLFINGTGAPHCANNRLVGNTIIGLNKVNSLSGITYVYAPSAQSSAINSNLVANNYFANLQAGILIQPIEPAVATITNITHNAFYDCTNNYRNDDDNGGFNNNTANDVAMASLGLDSSYYPTAGAGIINAGSTSAPNILDANKRLRGTVPSIGALEPKLLKLGNLSTRYTNGDNSFLNSSWIAVSNIAALVPNRIFTSSGVRSKTFTVGTKHVSLTSSARVT